MTRRLALVASAVLCACGIARADVLDDWTEQWLDTIRVVGGPPCPISRNGAVLYAGIYDAVNSIARTHEPYLDFVSAAEDASPEAAAVAAAHHVLVSLYPARKAVYDAQYDANMAEIEAGAPKANGIAAGIAAAEQILDARRFDRTDVEEPYQYLDTLGSYRPSPPDFTQPPFNPGWGTTQPWTMETGDAFRPKGPNGFRRLNKLLRSAGYANQLNEVKRLGRRDSAERTPEQTEIAWFWANDRDGTFKPPGQLIRITQIVANQEGLSFFEKARLMALASIAMGDAGLVAWDMKFSTDMDLWRPVTAIRMAADDGNKRTDPDPEWLPLLEFTPPFPAYTSGHATFAAAHAAVMRDFFGRDDITFTAETDEPIVSDVTRTFHSFTEAARENGLSRIYLGVHFRFDADIGYLTGVKLGEYVCKNHLRKIGCTADMNGDGRLTTKDLNQYIKLFFRLDPRADRNSDGQVDVQDFQLFLAAYSQECD